MVTDTLDKGQTKEENSLSGPVNDTSVWLVKMIYPSLNITIIRENNIKPRSFFKNTCGLFVIICFDT
jgi:hypothetical protein